MSSDPGRQLVEAFYSLPKERRDQIVRQIISSFIEVYRTQGALPALAAFIRWLASYDGAVVWGYLPRREFVNEWIELYRGLVELLSKVGTLLRT